MERQSNQIYGGCCGRVNEDWNDIIIYILVEKMVYKKKILPSKVKKTAKTFGEVKQRKIQKETVDKALQAIYEFGAEVSLCSKCKLPLRPRGMLHISGMCGCGHQLKYKAEYPQHIVDRFAEKCDTCKKYFDLPNHNKVVAPQLPTFERRSFEHGVSNNTRKSWAEEFQEFDDACEMCKDLVDAMVTELAMAGKYPPHYAMFYQKAKLGYEERKKLEVEGSGFNLLMLAEEAEKSEEVEDGGRK